MSKYYETVYQKRLNRYGLDYQSRIQSQRERDFDNYLYKTIYRVDFEFEGKWYPGSLERNKQDYSETQAYLLTHIDTKMPNGTVLMIQSKNGTETPWMVWWLEQIEASGYNRYVMLKMTHYLTWTVDGQEISQWGYFSGPGTSTISDTLKSSTGKPIYSENNNLHMFITPQHDSIDRDTYFEVIQGNVIQAYVVTEIDINSTLGVNYASVDPVPVRDKSAAPEQKPTDKAEDFYWLNGGGN